MVWVDIVNISIFWEQSKRSKSVMKYYARKKKKLKLTLSFLFRHLYRKPVNCQLKNTTYFDPYIPIHNSWTYFLI